MNKFFSIICPAIITGGLIIGAFVEPESSANDTKKRAKKEKRTEYAVPIEELSFAAVRDTVFVLGDSYIEISLREQKARQFFRNGQQKEYKISSGNPYIREGMATPTGIYSVQGKSRMAVSKQFKDAKLHFWVGFNGNIGFHGLDGRGYYWNLGVRPSSHGCVRIAREDGEKLYADVQKGTPVLVYKEKPARILAFADESDYVAGRDVLLEKRNRTQARLLNERLKSLYEGKFFLANTCKIFMDGKTPLWTVTKYDVGDIGQIAVTQEKPFRIGFRKVVFQRDRVERERPLPPASDSSLAGIK